MCERDEDVCETKSPRENKLEESECECVCVGREGVNGAGLMYVQGACKWQMRYEGRAM